MDRFVVGDVSEEFISRAKSIRAERDRLYGNIYSERASDLRWVGEVGELCFYGWAIRNTTLPIEWIQEGVAGNADFLIGNTPIGMKTVKRKGPPRMGYTAQITAKHAEEPVEHYFFASYEFPLQRLFLLGGIAKDEFLLHAKYHPAGDRVHENYTVREGHEIYNIEIGKLTPPRVWLSSLGRPA
ncbi:MULTISPECIES: hypothetical protein [Nocardia]|uniref:hypothetical protein n=1 Tax=Nocardia TaxID=1817 RepID=UPI0009FFD38F|nr:MULTISPECIES: hypothetical protein [Nocardia]